MDPALNDEIVMNSESGLACPALTGAGPRVDPLLNGFLVFVRRIKLRSADVVASPLDEVAHA
jgi:hypothetical protein